MSFVFLALWRQIQADCILLLAVCNGRICRAIFDAWAYTAVPSFSNTAPQREVGLSLSEEKYEKSLTPTFLLLQKSHFCRFNSLACFLGAKDGVPG